MSQVIVSHKNLVYLNTSLKYNNSIIIFLNNLSYLEFSEFRCDGSSMWLTFPDFEREKQITTSAKSQSVDLTKQSKNLISYVNFSILMLMYQLLKIIQYRY